MTTRRSRQIQGYLRSFPEAGSLKVNILQARVQEREDKSLSSRSEGDHGREPESTIQTLVLHGKVPERVHGPRRLRQRGPYGPRGVRHTRQAARVVSLFTVTDASSFARTVAIRLTQSEWTRRRRKCGRHLRRHRNPDSRPCRSFPSPRTCPTGCRGRLQGWRGKSPRCPTPSGETLGSRRWHSTTLTSMLQAERLSSRSQERRCSSSSGDSTKCSDSFLVRTREVAGEKNS
mmetsp:Transcript_41670/g.110285  ORF Transcript_41670/g.110285 Transcript_41670/m.110285 type:complete len:232 (+) Transcript_41670:468-1163(+)